MESRFSELAVVADKERDDGHNEREINNTLLLLSGEDIVQTGVKDHIEVARILHAVKTIAANTAGSDPDPQDMLLTWRRISKEVLSPHYPYELHRLLLDHCFGNWPSQSLGPPPAWIPTPQVRCLSRNENEKLNALIGCFTPYLSNKL